MATETMGTGGTGIKVKVTEWGVQTGTDRTIYAKWTFSREKTDHYLVEWQYNTESYSASANKGWYKGADTASQVKSKQCTFSAPSNAKSIRLRVKPVSETHKKNKKEVQYWIGEWSQWCLVSYVGYKPPDNPDPPDPPSAPDIPTPTVTVSGYTLTATVAVSDPNDLVEAVEFQIRMDNLTDLYTGSIAKFIPNTSIGYDLTAGHIYAVRARYQLKVGAVTDPVLADGYTAWSEYSESVTVVPDAPPTGITSCYALTDTSVRVEWQASTGADTYEVEYTTNADYFDSSNETKTVSVASNVQHAEITGLETGQTWFFRIRSTNSKGSSGWSTPVSVVIGKPPTAPTTWSVTTAEIRADSTVLLSWTHNSEDGSDQTAAEISVIANGAETIIPITGRQGQYSLAVNNSKWPDGTTLEWKVRTKGIIDTYSAWSITRSISLYAPATLSIRVDNSTLTLLPLIIRTLTGPATQTPVGYYLSISPRESYEATDQSGKTMIIRAGEDIFARNYDVREQNKVFALSASDISLANGITYDITCTVATDRGLSVSASCIITVKWTDEDFDLNAEIGVDTETITAYIMPFCRDSAGNPVSGVLLSVYRREFDGSFVELAKGIENGKNVTITDPHPALDYARYRIVATSTKTGTVSYYDLPGYPMGEASIIIQWDEQWSNFDTTEEAELAEPTWSGSMLKLPYNINTSDNYKKDVSFVSYIGRKHSVSYYGTQVDETPTWNVDVLADDEETIYALRRLANWLGDCYVREPSGSGYWAHVEVSFSRKHCELTIPVTLNITRVEGGA